MATKKQKLSAHTPPTITDVARKAGVSRTAVSYVLNDNGQRNKHVSDEARAKVLQAVQDLHFRPDALARALSKGHSEEIVLIVDMALSPFALEFITSLQQQALRYEYIPVLYFSQGFSAEQRKELHQTIFARRPIGIICSPFNFTAEDVALAREMGVKYIIFLGFHPEPIEQTYSIVFPSQALGYLAAQHLMARGHRHLALVHPNDALQEEGFLQRLEGMRAAIAEEPGVSLDVLPLDLSSSAALSLAETTLLGPERPTGIYAFSDEYAVVLLGALTRLGIRVPQDVGLVGTDNLPMGEFVWPSLTSICFDALDIGKRAVDMLHTLHQGLPLPEELTLSLVPQLIPREST
nr:LacI family DNA-binding transcriptional regulator [Ktedonobacteraceae bacterium]